jgi:hypothetical protein
MDLMLDSNVFDELLSGALVIDFESNPEIQIHLTHVQQDELAATGDVQKRESLLKCMAEIPHQRHPTESFAVGISAIGEARVTSGDGLIEYLRKGKLKHTKDALIAETAMNLGYILVTDDDRLMKKVLSHGGSAMSIKELQVYTTTQKL